MITYLFFYPLPPMRLLPSHRDRYMYIFIHFAHLPAHCGDVWFELGALGSGGQQPVARAVRLIRHAGQVRFPRWHHHLHLNLKVHQRKIFRPTFFAIPRLGSMNLFYFDFSEIASPHVRRFKSFVIDWAYEEWNLIACHAIPLLPVFLCLLIQ